MAGIATVLAGGAFAGETPRALTTEIAVGWNCESGRLEFMGLGATFNIPNGLKDGLDLDLKSG